MLHVILLATCLLSCTGQFVDDLQSFDEECIGEDKFPCASGRCVLQSQYCDGREDCDDGTDENFCVDRKPDGALCNATHQFLCHDQSACIQHYLICNNDTDCHDGSDELNCSNFTVAANATCKGFQCKDGRCISKLWVCDGKYDCEDKADEFDENVCRHSFHDYSILDGSVCQELSPFGERSYKCLDSSYCLPADMMCDGMRDCRDGSDEGPFCKNWHTMCNTSKCPTNESQCNPDRDGPTCICHHSAVFREYNHKTQKCEDLNECLMERPQCSHKCINGEGHISCKCDEGFVKDQFGYLCYAKGPEAMLFFSTKNKIKFLKIKTKQLVTVATGIKQAHGVSFDGQYIYWVDIAQGHQSIVRAHLEDLEGTREVLASLGLEVPGDISVDWLGRNLYFSDAVRGTISACSLVTAHCATVHTNATHPKFVTVDPRNGKMYWADHHNHSVIMTARMDGSEPEVLVDHLKSFGTGLALDVPNERLYFVDGTIKVVMLNGKKVYPLFEEPFHQPYAIAVFENTVFWSDLTSQTIQTADKLHSTKQKRSLLLSTESPIFGMHIYHPALMPTSINPCLHNNCSHLCYVTSNVTHVCGCPDGMSIKENQCHHLEGYRPNYLIVSGGQLFTKIDYNTLGNPETHATHFDIGRAQAMAYDSVRDTLYIYDGQRRSINYINMTDFSLGVTHLFIYQGLDNVVDMDYDYMTDTLYILDSGRRQIEVVSLRTQHRALLYKFLEGEIPISLCLVPDHGKMLVAVVESEQHNNIYIESFGLDGTSRSHVFMNNLKGPHVRLKYVQYMNNVFMSDEGNGLIDFMHPEGIARENFRELPTTVTSLALTDSYVFWTDRRTSRLYWSSIHESKKINRLNFSIFPNDTQLLIQATNSPPNPSDPLLNHPCLKSHPCTDVCVQSPSPDNMGYKCLCPTGYKIASGTCEKMAVCKEDEFYCHGSNICIENWRVCDGKSDCLFREDEPGCKEFLSPIGKNLGVFNSWTRLINVVWPKRRFPPGPEIPYSMESTCDTTEFQCNNSEICIPRALMCDKRDDCPDGSDETHDECDWDHCIETEFKCASGSCILKTWTCDGDPDCGDGSDELDCANISCKAGQFQCRNQECIPEVKRCDKIQDCFDNSDEEDGCEENSIFELPESELPHCADYEVACELDKSICIPITAMCNMKVDCPGRTDETCDHCASHGMFSCRQELMCVPMERVCNGKKDCMDASDETPDACFTVNQTSRLYPPVLYPILECHTGYLCDNKQCIEQHFVCDNKPDCYDGTDEGDVCTTACHNHTCAHACVATPRGPQCVCPPGFHLSANRQYCEDTDECADEVCSQTCINIPGSFLCTCHHGYALRADHRSCKATRGNLSVLYVSANTVMSITPDGHGLVEFNDPKIAAITDIDFDVRKNKLYVTSAQSGKLIEVNGTHNINTMTNVGRPSRVAVEWITGNVYFVDSTPGDSCVRVCNVRNKRCAKLQKLPSDATISSLIVDPKSRLMFYCVTSGLESVVWAASLSGHNAKDLTTVRNCTGLAADSFAQQLYVAETGPPHIIRMDYTGNKHKMILADHPQLQAPHSLAIFEDHIYYLVANSYRLNRCLLHGTKHCETFIYRMFDANTFVMHHESVQRDDIEDVCEGLVCGNVCVMDQEGPKCICDDGSFANGGKCQLLKKTQLPLFNGWTYQEYMNAHQASFSIITAVIVLLVLYLGLFVYYHFVYKPKRARASAYTEVRYQTSAAGTTLSYAPSLDMAGDGSISHEFVNPLQYVRNAWRGSFRSQKPIGTAGLTIEVSGSPLQGLSDTESDLGDTEALIIRRK